MTAVHDDPARGDQPSTAVDGEAAGEPLHFDAPRPAATAPLLGDSARRRRHASDHPPALDRRRGSTPRGASRWSSRSRTTPASGSRSPPRHGPDPTAPRQARIESRGGRRPAPSRAASHDTPRSGRALPAAAARAASRAPTGPRGNSTGRSPAVISGPTSPVRSARRCTRAGRGVVALVADSIWRARRSTSTMAAGW